MPDVIPDAVQFLKTRRSRPGKTLGLPVPDASALAELLEMAARTPDHGKLEPWRFIVLEHAACQRLARAVETHGPAAGIDEAQTRKMADQFAMGHLVVAVVSSPKPSEKIPQIEQTLSAGAVCLSLLNAALASGWGANWLSGWASHDAEFVQANLGLAAHESIAGLIHLGTETATPPERPRPDMASITTWVAT